MDEVLFKTLSKMKNNFSSNEFSLTAKKLGLNKRAVANGVVGNFLHVNAVQGDTRRMWTKRNQKIETFKRDKPDEIMYAIDLLKSNGYKILKQVSDWVDV